LEQPSSIRTIYPYSYYPSSSDGQLFRKFISHDILQQEFDNLFKLYER